MAFFEDVVERLGGSAGLGIGVAAAVLAPTLLPVLSRGLRPIAKGAIKGYLLMTTRARTAVADAGERLQDLYAEARSEVETGSAVPAVATSEG
jgi:hypothetical protein